MTNRIDYAQCLQKKSPCLPIQGLLPFTQAVQLVLTPWRHRRCCKCGRHMRRFLCICFCPAKDRKAAGIYSKSMCIMRFCSPQIPQSISAKVIPHMPCTSGTRRLWTTVIFACAIFHQKKAARHSPCAMRGRTASRVKIFSRPRNCHCIRANSQKVTDTLSDIFLSDCVKNPRNPKEFLLFFPCLTRKFLAKLCSYLLRICSKWHRHPQ